MGKLGYGREIMRVIASRTAMKSRVNRANLQFFMFVVFCGFGFMEQLSAQSNEGTLNGRRVEDRNTIASNQGISINVQDSSLAFVLRTIGRQAGRPVVLNTSNPQFAKRVNIRIHTTDVMGAFEIALKRTGLVAVLATDGKTIMVQPSDARANPDSVNSNGNLHGNVIDSATGKPVADVSMRVRGTKIATITNADGAFTLLGLKPGMHAVDVRSLGYISATYSVDIKAGELSSLSIKLRPATTMLSGVVTTATGQQRKLEVGNDITTIRVEEVIRTNPVSTTSELLATRVPGLYAAPVSGQPGAATRIRIRGVSSLNTSNEPIIVVDGVQIRGEAREGSSDLAMAGDGGLRGFTLSPLDQIDVNSIETIEVLKGPSAVALYGSDAANGVIVVTTKRGSAESARWTAALRYGIETMPGQWPMNYFSWGSTFGTTAQCTYPAWSSVCTSDSVSVYQILNNRNTTVLGRGVEQDYSVGVSGGVRGFTYSLTGSLANTLGLMKLPDADVRQLQAAGSVVPNWQRRPQAAGRRNGTAQIGADIDQTSNVIVTMALSSMDVRSTPLSAALSASSQLPPGAIAYNEDGELIPSQSGLLSAIPSFRERQTKSETGLRTAVNLQTRRIPQINTMLTLGLDLRNLSSHVFLPNGDCYGQKSCGVPIDSAYVSNSQGTGRVADMRLNMTGRALGSRWLSVTPSIGGNYASSFETAIGVNGRGLPVGAKEAARAALTSTAEARVERNTAGVYIETRIGVADRFWFPLGIRTDAGSSLGGNVMPRFPRVGFSYLLSEQPFFQRIPMLRQVPLLRIRSAFGTAGKQPLGVEKYRTYKPTSAVLNGSSVSALSMNSIGNTYLKPERSTEFEWGVDADLIEGAGKRLSMTGTWAHKKTTDLIVNEDLAGSLGEISRSAINLGDVLNTSLEIATEGLLDVGVVSWMPSVGITIARNTLQRLGVTGAGLNSPVANGIVVRQVVGYPLESRWAKRIIGYADLNSDGLIDLDEVQFSDSSMYLGSAFPKFTLNTTQQVTLWSTLTVAAGLHYEDGLTQIRDRGRYSRAENDPTMSLREQAYGIHSPLTYVQTVSTLRWTSLQLTYLAPRHLTDKFLGKRTASLALYGQNLGLWSTYRGKDPNVGAVGEGIQDRGALPTPRTIGIRVGIN